MSSINFYSPHDAFGCFSNFSRHKIHIGGKLWFTSEHYFQAQKFAGTPHEEEVRLAKGPGEAAALGRSRSLPLRPDWERVKDDVMREVLYHKFTQHKDIQQELLSTQDATLVEHTYKDAYWGDGGNGRGKNMLGKILMETRERIRAEQPKAPSSAAASAGPSSIASAPPPRTPIASSSSSAPSSRVSMSYASVSAPTAATSASAPKQDASSWPALGSKRR